MSIPSWFVIVMGVGTVFLGLICIILLCKILGAVCTLIERKPVAAAPVASTPAATPASVASKAQDPAKRQEIIAAIGAAIAEECGVDVNAIRITSIKKI